MLQHDIASAGNHELLDCAAAPGCIAGAREGRPRACRCQPAAAAPRGKPRTASAWRPSRGFRNGSLEGIGNRDSASRASTSGRTKPSCGGCWWSEVEASGDDGTTGVRSPDLAVERRQLLLLAGPCASRSSSPCKVSWQWGVTSMAGSQLPIGASVGGGATT